jgi:RNA polymerase sigma factor (sigma-70 family)
MGARDDPDELVRAARSGDGAALEHVIERCRPVVRGYLERRTGAGVRRWQSLSDLEQDALLRVPDLLARLDDEGGFEDLRALLVQNALWIVRNAARGGQRLDGESLAGTAGAPPAPSTPSAGEVTRRDELAWFDARLASLPAELAEVVRLRREGLSFAAIAARSGSSEATARRRFLEAAQRLCAESGDS